MHRSCTFARRTCPALVCVQSTCGLVMMLHCMHARRTFKSYADDLAQLADQLGVDCFFVAGVSGGLPRYTCLTAPGMIRLIL